MLTLEPNIQMLHIEATSICNAACPMCARNVNGEKLNPNIAAQNLTLEWFKHNLTTEIIKPLDKILFCGNLGDPSANNELLDIISYIKKQYYGTVIGINTNGSIQNKKWWEELATLLTGPLDYVVFSIDGLEDTNHLYRWNVLWPKVMENCQAYINAGGAAHWDMLVFEHNKHQVAECEQLARKLKFSWFRTKETDRWDTYNLDTLNPAEKYVPVNYTKAVPDCERNREKSAYIDYKGRLWPCCHIAEAYYNQIGYELHKDILAYTNTELITEYQKRLDSQPFYVCKRSCGTSTGKRSQWKQEIQL